MDSGFVPTLLQNNELSWAVNTTVRGGFLKPRPGFRFRALNFTTEASISGFEDGLFQGAGVYVDAKANGNLLVSVSGRIFSIAVADFSTKEITISGDRNSSTQPHAWFQQAENWTIIQNNLQAPLIWNGISLVRSVIARQVPVGGPMAYLKGRLWVAEGHEFFGGDLVNSNITLGKASVLEFTENTFLNEGGAFSAAGPITGMIGLSNIDTVLGDGDLLISTANAIYAFNAPSDRNVWKDLQYPIQRFAVIGAGAVSAESMVILQNDMLFRSGVGATSGAGVYSFKYARADFQNWGSSPVSRQAVRAFAYDTPLHLTECSGVRFNNRAMWTVQPEMVNRHGMIHRGLVVLDYYLVSGLGRKIDPCWEGVWTGLRILRILTVSHKNVQRCFIFALDDNNKIKLWELTLADRFDTGPDGDDKAIQWITESKSFSFATPREIKQLQGLENWYDSLTGPVEITAKFRPNLSECWSSWAKWNGCAKYRNCDPVPEGECQVPSYFRQQVRTRMAFPAPPEIVDPQSGGLTNQGYDFQIRMEGTGYLRLNRSVLNAVKVGDSQFGDFEGISCLDVGSGDCSNQECREVECCDPPDYGYQSADSTNTARITGNAFLHSPDDPTAYDIWSGRVGLDAAGEWITGPDSLLVPQFLFWGGLETDKLTLDSQTSIDGDYPYTSVVGETLSDQVYGAAKSATEPPWTDSLSIQQFDPDALGEPVSVDITSTTFVRCAPRAQNLDLVNAQDVTAGMTGTVIFEYPSTDTLVSLPSTTQVTVSCTAYVFPTDFNAPSGFVTDPPISNTETDVQTLTSSSPEWASLLGGGSQSWPASASKIDIAFSTPGPTDLAFEQTSPQIAAEISMEWHYHPFEGYWIFCIDNAAPWTPTSFSIPMATLADLGGPAPNRGEINGFGYEVVVDFAAKEFKLFRSATQVVAGGGSVTVVGTEAVGSTTDPFPGLTIQLRPLEYPMGPVLASDITNSEGFYYFDNLAAGDYVVSVVIPEGYEIDPDSSETIDVTLTAGQVASDKDFILIQSIP